MALVLILVTFVPALMLPRARQVAGAVGTGPTGPDEPDRSILVH